MEGKKRVIPRVEKEMPAEKVINKLRTDGAIVHPDMIATLKKVQRIGDAKLIAESLKDEFCAPVVRNLLNNGQCTNAKLWNRVMAWYKERNEIEKKAALDLLKSEESTIDAYLEVVNKKGVDLKRRFADLKA